MQSIFYWGIQELIYMSDCCLVVVHIRCWKACSQFCPTPTSKMKCTASFRNNNIFQHIFLFECDLPILLPGMLQQTPTVLLLAFIQELKLKYRLCKNTSVTHFNVWQRNDSFINCNKKYLQQLHVNIYYMTLLSIQNQLLSLILLPLHTYVFGFLLWIHRNFCLWAFFRCVFAFNSNLI